MEIKNVIQLSYGSAWKGYRDLRDVPYHLLMYMDNGSCTYRVGEHRYPVGTGQLLFIPAGLPRSAEPQPEAHIKYSVHWTGDGLFRHFPQLTGAAQLWRIAALTPYLKQAYAQMHQHWTRKDPYHAAQCESLLLDVCVQVHRAQAAGAAGGAQARLLRQVRDYIVEHFNSPLTIDELAALVGRNTSHLITSFGKHYGISPIAYMHRLRMTRAEELLLTTDAPIETIALELGYCDAAYFSRMFKRQAGIAPGAYRRQE
ncbi:helix-turn-helix transcriptional regulator [Paenibacillus sp. IB182496]|uniref:Helix-turn-helix transcriptional regulator n=1 Tax=Paenibacillus sabuli TaxID=2772509 RepID=A0A927GTJ7_9BACL|nr:AraC family transcriptional regulator [Paenibacillus sabuli]MBD2847653.1 helix-turn-helix transcriptional regulator [Paenibacillus sabuli]